MQAGRLGLAGSDAAGHLASQTVRLAPIVALIFAALFTALASVPASARDRCAPPAALGQVFVPPAPCFRMGAAFDLPTERYPHAVLGDAIEYGALIAYEERLEISVELPQHMVFEDLAPRLADLGGTGKPEILVVESHAELGARLAVYRARFVDG
ncbi:MAG: hypothetical protein AAGE13_07975, partial [Pseudomonadota bacterium]